MRGEEGEAGQEAAQHIGKDAHKEDDLRVDWVGRVGLIACEASLSTLAKRMRGRLAG